MNTRISTIAAAAIIAMASAPAAFAASDYLLELDGLKGESKASVEVASWSFGACNAGACASGSAVQTIKSPRDAATGQASGKRQHGVVKVTASQNTQSLRESPTRASTGKTAVAQEATGSGTTEKTRPANAGWDLATNKGARAASGVQVAAGDVDGDGLADLAYAGTQDQVESLSLNFTKIEWNYRQVCGGKHIAKATLRSSSDEFVIEHAMVECTVNPDQSVSMKLTGGQMKHTKTGHVTLLK